VQTQFHFGPALKLAPSPMSFVLLGSQRCYSGLLYLGSLVIDPAKFPRWESVDEVRLVANCVKHVEGSGGKQLAHLRPDLFEAPRIGSRINGPREFVELPLPREGIYFWSEEFEKMTERLKRFWEYIADQISG
jgi:hypothetical protein